MEPCVTTIKVKILCLAILNSPSMSFTILFLVDVVTKYPNGGMLDGALSYLK